MIFRRSGDRATETREVTEQVDSILGSGVAWQGTLTGTGGIRIDGAFDGEIALRGLVVIPPVSASHGIRHLQAPLGAPMWPPLVGPPVQSSARPGARCL